LVGGAIIGGRYRLRAKLGAGGMGEVWEAQHLVLNNLVAIKCVRNDAGDKRMAERLRLEANLISRLDHPNIVAVSDAGEDGSGRPYVVMERLRGRTLSQLLAERGALAWTQARGVAVQIAAGLAAAHAAGIVHRDLKPSNVFVEDDPHGNLPIKIIDFGLAKATTVDPSDRALTTSGTVFGTPTYMPPEQVRGESLDGRADIYALGAILYEMLTGRPPWIRRSHVELLYCHLFEPPPSVRQSTPDVPPDLEAVVQRCMCKDRALRFASADELRATLVGAGSGRGSTIAPHEVLPMPSADLKRRYANTSVSSVSLAPVRMTVMPAPRSNHGVVAAVAAVALVVVAGGVAWSTGLVDRLRGAGASADEAPAAPAGSEAVDADPVAPVPVTQPEGSSWTEVPLVHPAGAAPPSEAPPPPGEATQPAAKAPAPTKTAKHGSGKHASEHGSTHATDPGALPPATPAEPPPTQPAAEPPPAEPPKAEPPPVEPTTKTSPKKKGDLYEPFPDPKG
jgi:serine/threonine-protein kinase